MRSSAHGLSLSDDIHSSDDDRGGDVEGNSEDVELLGELEGKLSVDREGRLTKSVRQFERHKDESRARAQGGNKGQEEEERDEPRGSQHNGPNSIGVTGNPLKDRKSEGERLSRTGLGNSDAVST